MIVEKDSIGPVQCQINYNIRNILHHKLLH